MWSSEAGENTVAKPVDWVRFLPSSLTVLVLVVGIIGGWYTNKASLASLKTTSDNLTSHVKDVDDRTRAIEIQSARDSQNLEGLKGDMKAMREDLREIKRLLLRPRSR